MRSLWNDDDAARTSELDGLLYASRQIGADTDLVVWGGGNTSIKRDEIDYRGRTTRVLRVKGSGSDLKAVQMRDFPSVRLDDVLALRDRAAMPDDEMVAFLGHATMEPGSARPSIETLLHAFLPARAIIHTHADAILALTNTPHGERWVREALGPGAIWVPYVRPGFDLAQRTINAFEANAGATSIVLEKHGLVTWGATARDAYEATIATCTVAEGFAATRHHARPPIPPAIVPLDPAARRRVWQSLAPTIRGLHARTAPDGSVAPNGPGVATPAKGRAVLLLDDSDDAIAFAGHPAVAQLSQVGPATPDHLVATRRSPVCVTIPSGTTGEDAVREALNGALATSWSEWTRDYVAYVRHGVSADPSTPSPAELDACPRVIVLPGVGIVTMGRDARQARVVSDIYAHGRRVIRDAEAIESYTSLSNADAYSVEFWPMELYKLTLAAPEASLTRRVALVTGGASGIGRAIAERLGAEGAHVVVADLNLAGASAVAGGIVARHGIGRAMAVACDVSDEHSVAAAFNVATCAYGGLDILVSNAGIAPSAPVAEMSLALWQRSMDVNATGHFLATREALRLMGAQGTGGSVVFVATKNVMAPGKGFAAYSAAKAAQAQLARVVAMEAGAIGVRVNMINPDAVFRNSALWSPEVRRSRAAAHGVDEAGLEDHYRRRNLLGVTIDPDDVAEVAWWLASDRSRKTTGTVVTVDGGVAAAFPR
jgi:rhamnulose-1-phosphate aldolase/alcohol dehydrogenase